MQSLLNPHLLTLVSGYKDSGFGIAPSPLSWFHITQTSLLYTKQPNRKVYAVNGKVANNQEDTRNKPAATDQIPSAEIIHLRKVQTTMFIKPIKTMNHLFWVDNQEWAGPKREHW